MAFRTARPAWGPWVAWLLILATTWGMVTQAMRRRETEKAERAPDSLGAISMQETLVARLFVALGALGPSGQEATHNIARESGDWAQGPVTQRLARSILLAADGDRPGAVLALKAAMTDPALSAGTQEAAQPLYRVVASYLTPRDDGQGAPDPFLAGIHAPNDTDRRDADRLLGTYITLAEARLGSGDASKAAESEMAAAGMRTLIAVFVLAAGGLLALLAGLAAGITLMALAATGRIRSAVSGSPDGGGVLIEIFALWMLLLWGSQNAAKAWLPDDLVLPCVVVSMALTVVALSWGRVRGLSWKELREACGLSFGASPVRTVLCGVLAYVLGVLLLFVGLGVSFALGRLLGIRGLGNPTHPVHEVMDAGGSAVLWIWILAVGVAPIIEEIFFRGVLYRALRAQTRGVGVGLSIAGATIISGAVFGAIHPQGLLFAPVLGGLAAGFCLVREWTGRVVPGMLGHAINNAAMLGLASFLFR